MSDRHFKFWPAHGCTSWPRRPDRSRNPDVSASRDEACVIGTADAHRGETVKAVVVLRPDWRGRLDEQTIIDWCRQNMAAYKYPRVLEFAETLPKSGAGKIMWRELQDRELTAIVAGGQ
jgi:fatty-acyl-CoA synthase